MAEYGTREFAADASRVPRPPLCVGDARLPRVILLIDHLGRSTLMEEPLKASGTHQLIGLLEH